MKTFLVFLVLACARSEKLDLTYLPPPGSQYAGGRPEDIQVPLEFPKVTYTTTLRPQDFESEITNPEEYQATIGINRGLPTDTLVASDVTPGAKAPFSYFQNTYKVPTTTVSYAFTQTTTYPPTEGFETTIGPQIDGTGFPNQDPYYNFQPQEPSLTYQGNLDQSGFKPNSFGQQSPNLRPVPQYPEFSTQGSITTGNNQQAQNRPGFQQNIGQFNEQRPVAPTSGSIPQFTGSTAQPQGTVTEYNPSEYQFREQNPTFVTGFDLANNKQNLQIIGEDQPTNNQLPNYPNKPQPGYRQPILGVRPGIQNGQTQYPNQTVNRGGLVNQPNLVSSTGFPQEVFSTPRPSTTFKNRPNNIQGYSSTLRPNSSQTSYPNQIGVGQNVNSEEAYQRQPESPLIKVPKFNGNRQNVFQPSSTVNPTSFTPGIQNGQTSDVPEIYSTPVYPESQYNNQVNKEPSILSQRPERPQADTDRNAVILNYENVISPEGFAYSFDTSNGIHADESGTAINGVKAKGSYSYIGDDGKLYSVVYTADENGYQPHGDHLPTAPPVPEAIQAIIEKVKKEKEAGIYHDGSYDSDKYGHKKYEGTMHLGPLNSNKVFSNGADIPENLINGIPLQDTKPRKPLTGLRNPIVSSGDLSDFGVENEEQRQYGGSENDDGYKKIPDQITIQRPIRPNTAILSEDKDGSMQDDIDQTQYFKVSSKRPSKQPIRNPVSEIKGFSGGDNGDKIDSQQKEDQESFEYGFEKPYYENGASNTRVSMKGYSRRPTIQNSPQYYDQRDKASTGIIEQNSSKRPLTPGSSERPVINSPEQTFDKYENTRPPGKFSSKRPLNRPVIGNIQDQFQPDEKYNIQKGSTQFSYKPFEYADNDDLHKVTINFEDKEYVTELPSKTQSEDTKPSLNTALRNQTTSTRRRPAFIPKSTEAQNENFEYKPNDREKYIGSSRFENTPSQKYGGRRPSASNPEITGGENYKEIEQEFIENIPQKGYIDTSPPTFAAKYGGTRVRPTISRPLDKPQSFDQDNSSQVLIGDKKSNVAKFGQKLIKPYIYQQKTQLENEGFNKQPINETGYQYIPPQRKFEQGETKSFLVMYPGTSEVTSNMQSPQKNVFYEKEDVNTKPFMTPNVSRDDTRFIVDEYDQNEGTPETMQGNDQNQQNLFETQYSQYPDSGTTSDQIFGDKIISSTKTPSKYTSSTYGPSLPTSQTLRPQYHQNTQNIPGVKNNVVQIENKRPVQDSDRINGYKYTKVPYGGVTSTTPLPSNGPYYGSTFGSITPKEQNNFITGNTYQTPALGPISSTTPLPSSQKPTFDTSYQQNNNIPQYQTTFRPAETLVSTTKLIDGSSAQRLPPVSSTYSTSNVGANENIPYGNDLPSTTYRPNFAMAGANDLTTTVIPGIVVDGLGRPIRPGYSSTVQDYTPGSPNKQFGDQSTKDRYQPGETSGEPFRGQQRYRPGTKLGQQRVTPTFQSTTQKIIGEDFSGPKQQQKFDPETGYYY